MHKIFVKTAKAKSEGAKLSNDLKRMLLHIDGPTSTIELLKRLPDNLLPKYSELHNILLDGGYIVESTQQKTPVPIVKTPDIGERTYKLMKFTVATSKQEGQKNEQETVSQVLSIESNKVANEEDVTTQPREVIDITENMFPPTSEACVHSGDDTSTKLKIAIEKHAKDAEIIHDLKLENSSLMELLTDAYVQINALKVKE
jgi:hypothetical protein